MSKQLEEYKLDLIEIAAYRELEGQPFDFGSGLIKNDLSFGTEEAIWEMEQEELEEIIRWWNAGKSKNKNLKSKRKKYKTKNIDNLKLKRLSKIAYWSSYYDERKGRYIRAYYSGRKGYAKWCSDRAVRNRYDFSLKGGGYRKVFDYWWCVF